MLIRIDKLLQALKFWADYEKKHMLFSGDLSASIKGK
jgi:hypothetical protein